MTKFWVMQWAAEKKLILLYNWAEKVPTQKDFMVCSPPIKNALFGRIKILHVPPLLRD